jgi:hypothetical protein
MEPASLPHWSGRDAYFLPRFFSFSFDLSLRADQRRELAAALAAIAASRAPVAMSRSNWSIRSRAGNGARAVAKDAPLGESPS